MIQAKLNSDPKEDQTPLTKDLEEFKHAVKRLLSDSFNFSCKTNLFNILDDRMAGIESRLQLIESYLRDLTTQELKETKQGGK